MRRGTITAAILFWTASACASDEHRGEDARAAEPLRAALEVCAGLRQNIERLACYDHTVAQLASAPGTPETPNDVPQAMFGSSSRTAGTSQSGRAALDSIEAKVTSLSRDAEAALVVELDNGQSWRQQDSRELLLEIGDEVTISRAALGSFRIVTPKRRFGRVRRLE